MSGHDEFEEGMDERYELLGAYALDALDDDERAAVERLMAEDPRAADEVARHQETATFLAYGGGTAPEGVWERLAQSIDASGPAPGPGPELAKVLPMKRSRRRRIAAIVAAAAAVIAIVALSVALVRQEATTSPSQALSQAYERAATDPNAHHVDLASSNGSLHATAAVEASGTAYISAATLPRLGSDRTYQLWGMLADGRLISLTLLGPQPQIQMFGVNGDVKALAITNEKAGGVVQPTEQPELVGTL